MIISLFAIPIHILISYGYKALFVWSIMEGEIGLMLAGWLAHRSEVFTYEGIILVAVAGALIGDTSVFLTGRIFEKKAKEWLELHPEKRRQADYWIGTWGAFIIVFERFIYGTHIPVLLTFGMSGYSFFRFLLFDLIGIVLWAFTFVSLGYYFGERAIEFMLLIQKNLLPLLFIALIAVIVVKSIRKSEDHSE